jgi:hypothetical protein
VFAKMLRQEIETMNSNVAKAEAHWRSRSHAEGHVVELPERLVLIRARLAEASRMLDALTTRFHV